MTPADGIRVRVNVNTAALILSLLGAGYSVVWSAAKVSSAVESLQAIAATVQSLQIRVGVLEDRSNRPYPPDYPRSMLPLHRRVP